VALFTDDDLRPEPSTPPERIRPKRSVVVGWSFVACGVLLWTRRPANRLGLLMTTVGFLWLVGRTLLLVPAPVLFTTGAWLSDLWAAAFAPWAERQARPRRGFGVSVARGLVEGFGGKLLVTSQVGEGATFTIQFPHAT